MNIISYAARTLGAAVFALALVFAFAPTFAQAQFGDDGYVGGDSGYYGDPYTGGSWDASGFGDSGACDYGCDTYTGGSWDASGFGDTGSCDYGCGDYSYDSSYDYGSYDSGCYSCGGSSGSVGSGSFFSSAPRSVVTQPAPAPITNVNNNYSNNYNNNQNQNVNNVHVNVGNDDDDDKEEKKDKKKKKKRDDDDDRYVVYTPPPVYYPPTPYVTLSQTPYTGLELTPTQMVLYWGFLVLWCLVAAYLIAVKKVHTRIANRLKVFLFGDDTIVSHPVYAGASIGAVASAAVSPQVATLGEKFSRTEIAELANVLLEALEGKTIASYNTPVAAARHEDATDPFILSQITRNQ